MGIGKKFTIAAAVAIAALTLGAVQTQAESIEIGSASYVNNGNGTYTYTYDMVLTPTNQADTSSYFVLYDAWGITADPVVTTGDILSSFTLTQEAKTAVWSGGVSTITDSTNSSVATPDSAAATNLRFNYTASGAIQSIGTTALDLGSVSFTSVDGPNGILHEAGFDVNLKSNGAGGFVTNGTNVNSDHDIGPTAVPPPEAEFAGLGTLLGLGALGLLRRRAILRG